MRKKSQKKYIIFSTNENKNTKLLNNRQDYNSSCFVISFYLPGFYGDVIPFALFLIASFTDFLDGLLARMYKEESRLGELLDPIAIDDW